MRNIPTITRNLLIINVLAFLTQAVVGTQWGTEHPMIDSLSSYGGLHFFLDPNFHLWQLFTYMFLHGDFMHLFFNMFALWMFGCTIERAFGSKRFLIYYLVCGIGAGLFQELAQMVELLAFNAMSFGPTIGASGATYAILLAFGMTFPEERIFIFPIPFPIKAKWFVMLYAGIELFMALGSSNDGIAHLAHLGGMLVGLLLILHWRKHPYIGMGVGRGGNFFDKMREATERYKRSTAHPRSQKTQTEMTRRETDQEYNARKKANQEIIDRILDKIRKSGYDSLTKEEKKTLFDLSKND